MNYDGQIIRPPSEANSIILQVTVGCSHNRCTFCGAYKEKTFSIKDSTAIDTDLEFAARYCRRQHRVFLADGDALIIPFPRLISIFHKIHQRLPWINRISTYASAKSIRSKSIEQLIELKRNGLNRVYMGLESGCDEILKSVQKGETADSMIEAAGKVMEAGLFLSATVLSGLGQIKKSELHAVKTAEVLNIMQPNQIAALTLMPLDNTPLGQHYLEGTFELPSPAGIMRELRQLVENLNCPSQFHANHASNYLPIVGRLGRDKEKLLQQIDQAIGGYCQLKPERYRSL